MKLLLIDDDELDRQAIIRTFKKNEWDIQVVQASSAGEGLSCFNAEVFDAVLLDYRLPDIDGLDVLKLLTTHPTHHSAIIILTGAEDNENLERLCLEAGAQDVLFKSEIAHKHVTRAITHARTRYSLERQLQESHQQLQESHQQLQESLQQLKESHQRLRILAENDSLTGLTNRYFFDESLRAAIPRAERTEQKLALLFLDLDEFKVINDSLGHTLGDQILTEVARRLLKVIRTGDIVCRLGGDEFAVLSHDFESQDAIVLLAKRILDELSRAFVVNGGDYIISASIGIATYPEAADNASDMLRSADLAMYRAKRDNRNKFHFFSQALQEQIQQRVRLEKEPREQIPTNNFILYYQPIVDAQTFKIVGAEGLVRWNHATRGILPPSEFITLAEEVGLIKDIDTRSRRAACQQMAKWRKSNVVDGKFKLKFNICSQLLNDENLHLDIKRDIDASGIPGSCIGLEITESVMIENFLSTASLLKNIQDYGVDISVDDFGTGYSSMAYLKALPARTLKIDRVFVQGIPENLADCRILHAMIEFARRLDLTTIVEGVETPEQAKLCRDYGADFLQGYLISKPVSEEKFEDLLGHHDPDVWLETMANLESPGFIKRDNR